MDECCFTYGLASSLNECLEAISRYKGRFSRDAALRQYDMINLLSSLPVKLLALQAVFLALKCDLGRPTVLYIASVAEVDRKGVYSP